MAQTALVTAEQLFDMCEDERYELVRGDVLPGFVLDVADVFASLDHG